MSTRFVPRTNRTPWMDVIKLIAVSRAKDDDGYEQETETERTVCCTFSEGVNRTEFYEAMKAGIRASATVELWADEYDGEERAEVNGKTYSVVRAYETGRGTLDLTLTEVIR